MSNGTNNKCFILSKEEHFAKDCKENECWKTESDGSKNIWCCDYCKKEFTDLKKYEYHEKYCNYCNKKYNKYERVSDGSKNIWCCDYCKKEFTDLKKYEYHEKYCNYRNKNYNKYHDDDDDDDDCCFRCGREGHFASSCYASRDIEGNYLK